MSKTDIGKKWESVFKSAWTTQLPKSFIFRLKDNMNGFKETSGNPCDFLCLVNGRLLMAELKEHKGASIPFDAIPQYERLLKYKNIDGVLPGVIIWFSEKDLIYWVSIYEMEKMVNDGEKSIGIRMLKDGKYKLLPVPFEKKTVYLFPDCKFFTELKEGE